MILRSEVPERRKRLTMERIVGPISLTIFLRTVIGMGSTLECYLGNWESKSEISSWVARIKWCRIGE